MTEIDWSRPLEAVHEDGRVERATFLCHASGGTANVKIGRFHHNALKPSGYIGAGWRIRNVAEPIAAKGLGTVETPAPDLTARMEAHLRKCQRMYTKRPQRDEMAQGMWDELQELCALLPPEPVDPDLIEAREIVIDCLGMKDHPYAIKIRNGERDGVCQEALAGIKRGRALEKGETA